MVDLMTELGVKKKIIRIGSGDMQLTRKICNKLYCNFYPSFELELVDEHGTTPRVRNFNRRGTRDMHSVHSIAQRSGQKYGVISSHLTPD